MVDLVTKGARVSAILLSAGLSTRMGRNKALLPWMGTTLLEFQLHQLSRSQVQDIILVLGYEAELLRPPAARTAEVRIVVNPKFEQGRATSVVAGAGALDEGTSAVLILGVDQPRPTEIIDQVVQAHLQGPSLITMPTFEGHRGHPTIFDGSLIDELRSISESKEGLRQVVRKDPERVTEVPVSSPLVLLDLNTPQDYQRGLALFKNL